MAPTAARSIRGKLLAIFAFVLLVFVATAWVADRGLRGVSERARTFQDETLPQLLEYQAIESGFRSVVDAAGGLAAASDEQDLDRRLAQLEMLLGTLETRLQTLPESEPFQEARSRVRDYVQRLGLQVRTVLQTQAVLDEVLQDNVARLKELVTYLEDSILLEQGEGANSENETLVQSGMMNLVDILQLLSTASVEEVDELQSRFRVEVRGLGPSLASLSPADGKIVSDPLLEVLEQSAGEEGTFFRRKSVLLLRKEIELEAAAAVQELSALEQLANEVRDLAKASALEAREDNESARRRALSVLWGLFAVLLTALAATALYVERSILRRLRGMVDEVTALSRGELEVAVTPGGDRELAELADAAEVFRRNAVDLSVALNEVEASNAELSQFAYVASHDLKSPLRAISNLASWVLEDCGETLPAESRDHLQRMVSRVQRMETLLEDLLRYFRVGRERLPKEEVELGEVLRQVADLVAPEGAIVLELPGEELRVRVQRPPLELALRNLVANSLIHSDTQPVHLEARYASLGASGFRLDLIDDGPGIAPENAEKVFGMFSRLGHDHQGTGMGLALVRRITESVGGTARVVAREGRGAHLQIEWPGLVESEPVEARGSLER